MEDLIVETLRGQGVLAPDKVVRELANWQAAQATTMVSGQVAATEAERQAIMASLERRA